MSETATHRTLEWQGGSLDDLLPMLSEPALSVRIEIRSAGPAAEPVGEVHLVAGGVADAVAGSERGDAALDAIRKHAAPLFRIQPRLPDPESGTLDVPGPEEGTLNGRSLAKLMRYCEDFALTCALEVWRDGHRASISYRRGELMKVSVDDSDDPERLPEVIAWKDGNYQIVLPHLTLPKPAPAPSAPLLESKTLFGYPAMGLPLPGSTKGAPAGQPRPTLAFMPQATEAEASGQRSTRAGMPVDVYDKAIPDRTTDLGHPAIEPKPQPAPRVAQAKPVVTTMPERQPSAPERQPAGYRAPLPGTMVGLPAPTFSAPIPAVVPLRRGEPRHSPPQPLSAITEEPSFSRRRSARNQAVREWPFGFHILLGLGLGLAIVGGYWLIQILRAR